MSFLLHRIASRITSITSYLAIHTALYYVLHTARCYHMPEHKVLVVLREQAEADVPVSLLMSLSLPLKEAARKELRRS